MLLLGCQQNNMDDTHGIAVIDVVNKLGKYQEISASRFVSNLDYIVLETSHNCPIEENWALRGIIVTASHIFIASRFYCYTFDRGGRFIGNIGSRGQGPGEYQVISGISVDEENQTLYIETLRTILEYSWDGTFRQTISVPKSLNEIHAGEISFVRDSLFIGHINNRNGNEPKNFLLFNKSGQIVKSFNNHVIINRTQPYGYGEGAMKPFSVKGKVYVKEISNDTLYFLNEQNKLVRQFVFGAGNYGITKEKRRDADFSTEHEIQRGTIRIPSPFISMVGIPDFIFFSFTATELPGNIPFPENRARNTVIPSSANVRYVKMAHVVGLYDIDNQQTQLLDTDPVSNLYGLINDLDGGLSFWPRYYTSNNELVDVWNAFEMKEILTEKYFAAHEIKDAKAHQKLKALLKGLDFEDNPVIVIGKLK